MSSTNPEMEQQPQYDFDQCIVKSSTKNKKCKSASHLETAWQNTKARLQ